LATPRYASTDLLERSRELRAYLKGESADVPAELASLEDHEFLLLICWLPHFVAIPDCVLVRPSPHEAVTGFGLAKRWPECFDKAVHELLIRCGRSVPVFEEALFAIERVPSPAARTILEGRLISPFQFPAGLLERGSGFMEPVAKFGGAAQGFEWPSPADMKEIWSNQKRRRRKPSLDNL
jgi:hypothetical protein